MICPKETRFFLGGSRPTAFDDLPYCSSRLTTTSIPIFLFERTLSVVEVLQSFFSFRRCHNLRDIVAMPHSAEITMFGKKRERIVGESRDVQGYRYDACNESIFVCNDSHVRDAVSNELHRRTRYHIRMSKHVSWESIHWIVVLGHCPPTSSHDRRVPMNLSSTIQVARVGL